MTTEVTQKQWEDVLGYNPSNFLSCGVDCPVEGVSWRDTQYFIEEINKRGEGIYRLPTEAEWEYASRAGSTTAFSNGDATITDCTYDPILDAIGWYCGNSGDTTQKVAQKEPNSWGLYDMHGNVAEWCQDWYQNNLGIYDVTDPAGPSTGQTRVYRGGAFWDWPGICRSACRYAGNPIVGNSGIGIRLVISNPY